MKFKCVRVGRRVYSHPLVVGLIECYREISQNPLEIMRRLIRDRLDAAMNLGWSGPPYDPRSFASTMGIASEESKKLILSEDAELHPSSGGKLVIRYNPDRPKTRQNFSIAHEISHTLFPDYQDRFHTRHKVDKYNPHNELEFLCDFGASEIIMPTPEFDSEVQQNGISLKSLKELSTRYEASREASAIRMIRTDLYTFALVVLNFNYRPTDLPEIENKDSQQPLIGDSSWWLPFKKLRVEYFDSSKRFSKFIPKHVSIDESCPLYDVSVTKDEFRGNICLDLDKQFLEFYAEAMPIPGTNDADLGSRVLVLLFHQ